MANVIWNDKQKKWTLRTCHDGQYKTFASRKAGIQGKKEVLARYREWLNKGTTNAPKTHCQVVWDKFIESTEKRLGSKSATLKQYKQLGRLYILPAIGFKRMQSLRKPDFQSIIDNAKPQNKRTKILSEKYLKNIRGTIISFIDYSVDNGYMEDIRGTLYIPKGHPVKEKTILQPCDIKELLRPSDLQYHKALCFIVCTGIRPGECLGIKWSDINNDVLTIKRSVNIDGDITEGKNKNARRFIPLAGITKQILAIQRENTQHLRSEWVFCNSVGGLGNQHTMANQLVALGQERNFSVSPYELRHTFVSLMKNTMPEQMIKTIVGHSASMDTFGVYGHLVNGEMQQAAEIIELRINDINEDTGK